MQCGQEHALIYAKDSGKFEYTGDDDDEVFVCEIQVLIARITWLENVTTSVIQQRGNVVLHRRSFRQLPAATIHCSDQVIVINMQLSEDSKVRTPHRGSDTKAHF